MPSEKKYYAAGNPTLYLMEGPRRAQNLTYYPSLTVVGLATATQRRALLSGRARTIALWLVLCTFHCGDILTPEWQSCPRTPTRHTRNAAESASPLASPSPLIKC